jgi:hypothetical protein
VRDGVGEVVAEGGVGERVGERRSVALKRIGKKLFTKERRVKEGIRL